MVAPRTPPPPARRARAPRGACASRRQKGESGGWDADFGVGDRGRHSRGRLLGGRSGRGNEAAPRAVIAVHNVIGRDRAGNPRARGFEIGATPLHVTAPPPPPPHS